MPLATALTHRASLLGKTSAREGVTSVPTPGWNYAVERSGRDPREGSEQPWFVRSWLSMLEMYLTFVQIWKDFTIVEKCALGYDPWLLWPVFYWAVAWLGHSHLWWGKTPFLGVIWHCASAWLWPSGAVGEGALWTSQQHYSTIFIFIFYSCYYYSFFPALSVSWGFQMGWETWVCCLFLSTSDVVR